MAPSPGGPAAGYMAIVRHGRGDVFLALDTCLAQPGVTVVWDRRGSERRRRSEPVSRDRRAGERRGPSPSSWRWPGFVIVDVPGETPGPPEASRKRVLVVDDDRRVREVIHQALVLA